MKQRKIVLPALLAVSVFVLVPGFGFAQNADNAQTTSAQHGWSQGQSPSGGPRFQRGDWQKNHPNGPQFQQDRPQMGQGFEHRQEQRQERREEFMKNHPQAREAMEQRHEQRQESREEFMKNHPQASEAMAQRREERRDDRRDQRPEQGRDHHGGGGNGPEHRFGGPDRR